MSITIQITGETAGDVRADMTRLLGYEELQAKIAQVQQARQADTAAPEPTAAPQKTEEAPTPPNDTAEVNEDDRLVGAPGGGRQRRNSTEKTADDDLVALAQRNNWTEEQLNKSIAERGRAATAEGLTAAPAETKASEEPAMNIQSSPEDRKEPEAANDMLAGDDAPVPTIEDVRPKLAAVIKEKGEAEAGKVLRQFVPDGEPMKLSSVPKEKRAALVAACEEAVAG